MYHRSYREQGTFSEFSGHFRREATEYVRAKKGTLTIGLGSAVVSGGACGAGVEGSVLGWGSLVGQKVGGAGSGVRWSGGW